MSYQGKKIFFARLRKSWISDAIISLNRKHKLFRQYKNGIVTFDHYNSFKNNFTTILLHAKNSYFQRKFTECSNNSKDALKTLNSLIRCKNASKDVTLNHNGSSISDPSIIAEVNNNYFSNIASNLDHNIPHSNISPLNILVAPVENSFFCPPSDSEEIDNLIRMQKKKSTDLMNIPVFIYKILASLISHTVSMLFNNPLSEGIFPECFKMVKIIPIFKSGDSNSLANYRPISMLPFLSKMFEKLVCARRDSYLKSNNILRKNLFGFCKNSNTSDAIIEFIDYVYSSLDKKQSAIALYLDYSKAFDTINQDKLMSKLHHNGIKGVTLSWFKSYICNMKQYVSVKNSSSSLSNITLGVPQGSVLGPVLFVLHINDMHRSSNKMHFVHFADDTTVFASDSDINNVHASVNR